MSNLIYVVTSMILSPKGSEGRIVNSAFMPGDTFSTEAEWTGRGLKIERLARCIQDGHVVKHSRENYLPGNLAKPAKPPVAIGDIAAAEKHRELSDSKDAVIPYRNDSNNEFGYTKEFLNTKSLDEMRTMVTKGNPAIEGVKLMGENKLRDILMSGQGISAVQPTDYNQPDVPRT